MMRQLGEGGRLIEMNIVKAGSSSSEPTLQQTDHKPQVVKKVCALRPRWY